MLIEVIFAILIGLIAGGIVNILADDLPLRRAPRLPRYVPESKKRAVHVPVLDENGEEITLKFVQEDDEPRPPIAWLGLSAFLFGKRVSPSGVKLNWRYPLVEVFTVLLMLLAFFAVNSINSDARTNMAVDTLQFGFWLIYMGIFALITVIDIEHKLILFVVIIPACGLAVLDALITTYPPALADALIGGAAGFIVFFLLYNGGFVFTYIAGALRGKPIDEVAFGYGDVMMATFSGLVLGWQALIFAMFITVFLGAFGAVFYLLTKALLGRKYSAFTALPYGPYIVAGTILMLFFRADLGPLLGGRILF